MPETSVSEIPTLSDDEIEARVGSQSFQRGQRYFRNGSIFDARQQGMALKARCLGSSGGPYRLRVFFGPDGIAGAYCSCPVGAGGYCKHVAALLLTWRERPEEFLPVEELDVSLEQRSKEELIALIQQMLRQEPELESLLEMPLPTANKRAAPVDVETYRRQTAAVFARAEDGWGAWGDMAEQLLAITSIGDGFARQQDYASAAAVYEAVLLESLEHFYRFQDDSDAKYEVVMECVGNLGECLANGQDQPLREHVLRALFEVYRFDIDQGGTGLPDEALGLIYEQTTPEERHMIAGWVREAMPSGGSSPSGWGRAAYGGLLLNLEADTLDDEDFLRICSETGRLADLVDRLLSLGRADEAVKATRGASDYDLLQLASIFVQRERGDLADKLILERSRTATDTRLFDWLKNRAKTRGDAASALELAEKVFRSGRPDLVRYKEIRELAQETGQWDALRPQTLSFLRKGGWNDLLIVIYLDEGEVDEALKVFRSLDSRVMGYSYGLYGTEPLALQVARAAEETQPYAALDIYGKQVERQIAGRNRGSYGEAARLLARMRDVYTRLGEDDAWSRYIEDLRQRYKALRALKEELAAAGL